MADDKDKQTTLDESASNNEEKKSSKKKPVQKEKKEEEKKPRQKEELNSQEEESTPQKEESDESTTEDESKEDESNILVEFNKENLLKTASVLGAIILILLVGIALSNQQQPQQQEEIAAGTVLATVGNQNITQGDLQKQQTLLQSLGSQQLPEEESLELLIDETALYLEAQERDMVVTREEAEQQLQEDLQTTGTTVEAYRSQLEQRNIDYDELITYLQKQLSIANVLDDEIQNSTTPTQQEIEEQYNQSREEYTVPRTATVRQILLSSDGENQTVREEAERIQNELDQNTSLFCNYVENTTADEASIPNCGEYNVTAQDPYVDEFKEAALNMTVGEIRIVRSDFGYHILLKDSEQEERIQPLTEVQEQIRTQLRQQAEQERVPEIAQEIRQKYNVTYPEETTQQPTTQNTTQQNESNTSQNTTPQTEPEEETTPEETEQQEEQVEAKETESEETEGITSEQENLAQCLEEAQATLYIVDWSPESQEQQVILGNLEDNVTIIDCDEQQETCNRQGINAYPVWELNNEQSLGIKTRTALRNTLSCQS